MDFKNEFEVFSYAIIAMVFSYQYSILRYTMRLPESFQRFFFLHFEWAALLAALILMAFINPSEHTFSFCILDQIGVSFCPGEGFGRSVALLFRGDIVNSFQMHPLGIPGTIIIVHRIFTIFQRNRSLKLSI